MLTSVSLYLQLHDDTFHFTFKVIVSLGTWRLDVTIELAHFFSFCQCIGFTLTQVAGDV
jgi:hypothetical protein